MSDSARSGCRTSTFCDGNEPQILECEGVSDCESQANLKACCDGACQYCEGPVVGGI